MFHPMKKRTKYPAALPAAAALSALAVTAVPAAAETAAVSPGLTYAAAVNLALLAAAALIRALAVPRFRLVPGNFQLLLETVVGAFAWAAGLLGKAGRGIAAGASYLAPGKLLTLFSSPPAGQAAPAAPPRDRWREDVLPWLGENRGFLLPWLAVVALLLIGSAALLGGGGHTGTVQAAMRDAVLHDENHVSLLGLAVNPGLISAMTVSAILLLAAALIRLLVIPRFTLTPGKFQRVLELAVGYFDSLAQSSSPRRNKFLGAYVFAAGTYIFAGTLFELLGLQAVTTAGHSITLPAPLSDVNAAICLGCLSYLVIMSGGIAGNGLKGVGGALKEFSLPISMSFRLFGALLSGLLVTELVYYYVQLSFVLPVVVGVLFTLLHAVIQTYVLTMLTAMYYGEVSHPGE